MASTSKILTTNPFKIIQLFRRIMHKLYPLMKFLNESPTLIKQNKQKCYKHIEDTLQEIYSILIRFYYLKQMIITHLYPADLDEFMSKVVEEKLLTQTDKCVLIAAFQVSPRKAAIEILRSTFKQFLQYVARLCSMNSTHNFALHTFLIKLKESLIQEKLITLQFISETYAIDRLIELLIAHDHDESANLSDCMKNTKMRLCLNPGKLQNCFRELLEILSEDELRKSCQLIHLPNDIIEIGLTIKN